MAGYVLYEGPSNLDGEPIVVIATTGSRNSKTGDMIQTWVMRSDITPVEAIKNGEDFSVCGDCKHRGNKELGVGRSCYVTVAQAPQAIFRAYKHGSYTHLSTQDYHLVFRNKAVRLGSYGDFAAVPSNIAENILKHCRSHSGYTHQWERQPNLASYLMASVDSARERQKAKKLGFRTFRIGKPKAKVTLSETHCPASEESKAYKKALDDNRKLPTCETCGLCKGSQQGNKDIFIRAHGNRAIMYNYNKLVKAFGL